MKTLLASFLLTGCIVGGSTGTSNNDIIGGTDDPGDPAVGLVRLIMANGGVGVCTATAIAPTLAVTAAHCAQAGAITYDINFSEKPDIGAMIGSPGYLTAQLIADPAYDGNPLDGHDVSVVVIANGAAPDTVQLGAAPGAGAPV